MSDEQQRSVALKIAPPGAASVNQPPADDLDDVEADLDAQYAAMGSPEVPQVSEAQVRAVLVGATGGLAFLIADPDLAPNLGRMEPDELDDLVPPLTRIVNNRPALRAAVIRGDEAAAALVLLRYGMRTAGGMRALHVTRDRLATREPLNATQEPTE